MHASGIQLEILVFSLGLWGSLKYIGMVNYQLWFLAGLLAFRIGVMSQFSIHKYCPPPVQADTGKLWTCSFFGRPGMHLIREKAT